MKMHLNNDFSVTVKSHLGQVTIDRRELSSLTDIGGALTNIYKTTNHDFLMSKAAVVQRFFDCKLVTKI